MRIPLAREGYPFIGGTVVAAAALWWAVPGWLAVAATAAAALTINFFRDPERRPPDDPEVVVAPADGRVVVAQPVDDRRFGIGEAIQVSIFMSPLDVHVNRNPAGGRVVEVRYHPGRYFRAFADKASLENEQNAVILEVRPGARMAFVQIAGFVARRIVCYLRPGMRAVRGERCGMILFGSRVDVFLPRDAELSTRVGARTRAGETEIARWKALSHE